MNKYNSIIIIKKTNVRLSQATRPNHLNTTNDLNNYVCFLISML